MSEVYYKFSSYDGIPFADGINVVAVELTNATIDYNREIARFTANVLVGN